MVKWCLTTTRSSCSRRRLPIRYVHRIPHPLSASILYCRLPSPQSLAPIVANASARPTRASNLALAYTNIAFICPAELTAKIRHQVGVPTYQYEYIGNFSNISPLPWMGERTYAKLYGLTNLRLTVHAPQTTARLCLSLRYFEPDRCSSSQQWLNSLRVRCRQLYAGSTARLRPRPSFSHGLRLAVERGRCRQRDKQRHQAFPGQWSRGFQHWVWRRKRTVLSHYWPVPYVRSNSGWAWERGWRWLATSRLDPSSPRLEVHWFELFLGTVFSPSDFLEKANEWRTCFRISTKVGAGCIFPNTPRQASITSYLGTVTRPTSLWIVSFLLCWGSTLTLRNRLQTSKFRLYRRKFIVTAYSYKVNNARAIHFTLVTSGECAALLVNVSGCSRAVKHPMSCGGECDWQVNAAYEKRYSSCMQASARGCLLYLNQLTIT